MRVDIVHQGDQDGVKGIYHLNMVDEVIMRQVVGAVAHISEIWLKPLLEAAWAQFPFQLKGFHSDNGSEFINYKVAEMLQKLLIEQTKSRPRHSNDNGLVESKNGAVVRKHREGLHIEAQHADPVQTFYREHLYVYLNFHRPCGQAAEIETDAQGKQQRVYRCGATPWDIFLRYRLTQYDHPSVLATPMESLLRASLRETDTESAVRDARGQTKAFTSFPAPSTGVLNHRRKPATEAVEMTGPWKA